MWVQTDRGGAWRGPVAEAQAQRAISVALPYQLSVWRTTRLFLQQLHAAGRRFQSLVKGLHGETRRADALQLALEVQDVRRAVRQQLFRLVPGLRGGAVLL